MQKWPDPRHWIGPLFPRLSREERQLARNRKTGFESASHLAKNSERELVPVQDVVKLHLFTGNLTQVVDRYRLQNVLARHDQAATPAMFDGRLLQCGWRYSQRHIALRGACKRGARTAA